MLVPLCGILAVAAFVALLPEQSFTILELLRDFFGNRFGDWYIILGLGVFYPPVHGFFPLRRYCVGADEKPAIQLRWGSWSFPLGQILSTVRSVGVLCGRTQDQWGPGKTLPTLSSTGAHTLSFYISLAVVFGYAPCAPNGRQKISETCRPLLSNHIVFGWKGHQFGGCVRAASRGCTTLGVSCLYCQPLSPSLRIPGSIGLTLAILFIAILYTLAVWFGVEESPSFPQSVPPCLAPCSLCAPCWR